MQVGYVQSFCLFKISLEIPNLFIGVQKKNILNIICSSKCVLISFRCGILIKVSPNKQDFLPKINILKGNHCILRIQGVLVHQKLGMILENKVVQKLELEKNVFF